MKGKEILKIAAKACHDMRAKEITALNMKELSVVADYFLICHATNERQVKAIAREVKDLLEKNNAKVNFIEGYDHARWIVIDTGYVLCHIFHEEERRYYNLERLWGDANLEELPFLNEG